MLIILANIRYFGVNSDCQTSIAHLLLDNQPYEFRLKFENIRNEKVQIPFDTTQKNIVTISHYPSSTMFPPWPIIRSFFFDRWNRALLLRRGTCACTQSRSVQLLPCDIRSPRLLTKYLVFTPISFLTSFRTIKRILTTTANFHPFWRQHFPTIKVHTVC